MLTRSGVAKRIRKSLATVRRMEGNELHPEVDENGVHWFDEDEVDQVARGRGGRRPVIPTRCRRDGSIFPSSSRHGLKSWVQEAAIERRQREHDLKKAKDGAATLKAELDAAKHRIEELNDEHRKMRSIMRTLGTLFLTIAGPTALMRIDPTLMAVIRACASYED